MNDLGDLQARIKQARADGVGDTPPKPQDSATKDRNQGIKAGTELLTSMIAGGILGYGLDEWLETRPLMFMICLILGVFAGFWSLYRNLKNMGSEVGFARLHNDGKQGKETQRFSGTSEED